jgi:hypothetical protein
MTSDNRIDSLKEPVGLERFAAAARGFRVSFEQILHGRKSSSHLPKDNSLQKPSPVSAVI